MIKICNKYYDIETTKELDLNNNKLTEIPIQIFQLTNLQTLNLSRNKITEIPIEIGLLTNLQSIRLNNNNISEIPIQIFQLINLQTLNLSRNKISEIPIQIFQLTNLLNLNLSENELIEIPVEIGQLTNLRNLDIYFNKISKIPVEIGQLTNLQELILNLNNLNKVPDEISQLTNLHDLCLGWNQITEIPISIGQLTNLQYLDLSYNKLSSLPNQLINLTNCIIYYDNNPIVYFSPILYRFLNRQRTINTHIYNDSQNVHDSNIQQSIKESIIKLMSKKPVLTNDDTIRDILENNLILLDVKQQLTEYSQDKLIHSYSNCTFEEALTAVWDRIRTHNDKDEIIKILNQEMKDTLCKCFTGRLSRLINCLNGFDSDVEIRINDNQQIGNIILLIKELLIDETGNIDLDKWKAKVIEELKDRGYKDEIIDEWIQYIDV